MLIHGPATQLFEVYLPPQGWTTGARFQPGGFAVLLDVDASTLRDSVLDAASALPKGSEVHDLRRRVLAAPTEEGRWDLVESWLAGLHEEAAERISDDPAYPALRRAVDLMKGRERVRLEPVADAVHCSVRTLQRWSNRYVGVSPLRVLRRHRLRDVTAALDAGEVDLARLAADRGFSDRAHLTREFTAAVGVSPCGLPTQRTPGPMVRAGSLGRASARCSTGPPRVTDDVGPAVHHGRGGPPGAHSSSPRAAWVGELDVGSARGRRRAEPAQVAARRGYADQGHLARATARHAGETRASSRPLGGPPP